MKLKQTKGYLLLIDEEAEITKGDYLLEKESIINIFPDYLTDIDECNKIIAYYPLTKEAKELDLPLLPSFENNFDLKQEIIRWYYSKSGTTLMHDPHLNEIIGKAQSKQFSLEDMIKAIDMARTLFEENMFDVEEILGLTEICTRNIRLKYSEEEIIQSLSTQQLPLSFEPEYEYLNCLECEGFGWMLSCSKCKGEGSEKTSKFKTTANSDGKEEIQGTYKY